MDTEPTNLTMHRAAHNVWDRQQSEHSRGRTMGIVGFLMIAAGTCLVAQSCKSNWAFAVKSRMMPKRSRGDEVNTASEESFPASDPPAWTPAVGKPRHAENH